ncbi:MAG: TIGR03745 family integrating conjugative element membrane protein [Candidatus Competibacteraceae bacterium]|nr:TIGR03745 family integrating conjugative element membrane protein [Candidatus Competibacteraceae bacterium]
MKHCKWSFLLMVASLSLLAAAPVLAAIPAPSAPTGVAATSTDWLDVFQGYVKDGLLVLATAISAVSFAWVSWSALAKFNEARVGRAEWGEVGLLGGGGVALLLLTGFLLTTATGIL